MAAQHAVSICHPTPTPSSPSRSGGDSKIADAAVHFPIAIARGLGALGPADLFRVGRWTRGGGRGTGFRRHGRLVFLIPPCSRLAHAKPYCSSLGPRQVLKPPARSLL